MAWRRLRRNRAAMLGGVILLLFVLMAIFADVLAKQGPEALPDFEHRFAPPMTEGFVLGTDDIGRDVLSRVIHGSRISLRVGIIAVLLAAAGGTLIGLAAGYFGGWVDMLISRVIDVLLAFPGLLLAIVIVASLGPGLQNAMFALGVAGIPYYARVVRGSTLAAKELGYVRAARAVGMRDTRIMIRHILPNIVSPILIMATLGLGTTIISAAGLSFLGLGASPPTPEWGLELSQSRGFLAQAPWISISNGVALALTVLSINMFGDGLREALDPQATSWAK
ncbi:MAG: ABC transporter permease [Actinobacteria bacterium]|nr:ABC transporter permease [Actinomycetota bacterium]